MLAEYKISHQMAENFDWNVRTDAVKEKWSDDREMYIC